jgi:hypothetical protein
MAASIGITSTIFIAGNDARDSFRRHQSLVCAHEHTGTPNQPWTLPWDAFVKTQNPFEDLIPIENREISLKQLGCSNSEYDTVKFAEALKPSEFSWLSNLAPISFGLALTLMVTFAVYGIVRAIGWVIGGFAAS